MSCVFEPASAARIFSHAFRLLALRNPPIFLRGKPFVTERQREQYTDYLTAMPWNKSCRNAGENRCHDRSLSPPAGIGACELCRRASAVESPLVSDLMHRD